MRDWRHPRSSPQLAFLVAAAVAFPLACGGGGGGGGGGGERASTNVVLISIDCLNQRQFREALDKGWVPGLARVAGDALVFSDAHAHAPWTTPSHMSMLTGLYPTQHGRDVPWGLMTKTNEYYDRVPLFPTLGDLLGSAGYETVAFVGKGSISAQFGLSQGFGVFQESPKEKRQTDLPVSVERCLAWLAERSDRPFFLFFHTYDLHSPRMPQLSSDKAALGYIDRHLGKVLDELEKKGLYESTLILVTGDHGSSMVHTEGKCCVHGSGHYEENLNVPLVVKLPGSASKGASDRLVRHVDILPTVIDVVGLPLQKYRGRGASVLGLSGEVQGRISFSSADARCTRRYALVDGNHKYIYSPRDELQMVLRGDSHFMDNACRGDCAELPEIEELFDLRQDPFEQKNLLAAELDADTQGLLDRFRELMLEHLNLPPEYVRRVVGTPGEAIDAELEESMRALGYIR